MAMGRTGAKPLSFRHGLSVTVRAHAPVASKVELRANCHDESLSTVLMALPKGTRNWAGPKWKCWLVDITEMRGLEETLPTGTLVWETERPSPYLNVSLALHKDRTDDWTQRVTEMIRAAHPCNGGDADTYAIIVEIVTGEYVDTDANCVRCETVTCDKSIDLAEELIDGFDTGRDDLIDAPLCFVCLEDYWWLGAGVWEDGWRYCHHNDCWTDDCGYGDYEDCVSVMRCRGALYASDDSRCWDQDNGFIADDYPEPDDEAAITPQMRELGDAAVRRQRAIELLHLPELSALSESGHNPFAARVQPLRAPEGARLHPKGPFG